MAKTVVGVFRELSAAQVAIRELGSSGIAPNHIQLIENGSEIESVSGGSKKAAAPESTSLKDRISDKITGKMLGLLESLFDVESDRVHAQTYAEAVGLGHYLVVADVEAKQVDSAVAIMNRYGTVDLTQEHWRTRRVGEEAGQHSQPIAEQREATEEVVQEELVVGTRVVQRGAVRVHSYVEERPVEEVVRLREERLNVERRPADRAVSRSEVRPFEERSIEVTAEGEEAVVEKRARVVEEVVVNKELEQREQTVRDTVRRKDVEVQAVPAAKTAKPANTTTQAASAPPRR